MASTTDTSLPAPLANFTPGRQTLVDPRDFGLASGSVSLVIEAADLDGRQGLWSRDAFGFGGGGHASLWLEGSKVVLRFQGAGENHVIESDTGAITADETTQIGFTFGGADGLKLYVDGVEVAASGYTGGLDGNDEPLVLGALATRSSTGSADNLSNAFRGEIDSAAIYDEVLTGGQMQTLADAIAPSSPPAPPPPPPADPDDALVAEWSFDDRSNGVLTLDGRDDFFELSGLAGNTLQLTQGTISLAVTLDQLGGKHGLWSKDSAGFDDGGHASLWVEGSQVLLRLQSTNQSVTLRSEPGAIEAGKTAHVAFTFGGADGLKLYVDGALVASHAYRGGLLGNAEPVVIGALATASGNGTLDPLRDFAGGRFDDVRIYAEALDAEAIAALAGSPPSSPPPPPPPPPSGEAPEPSWSWAFTGSDARFDGVDHFWTPGGAAGATPSLMILGDSFTVDWRGFPSQLDAALDARGYDVEVIAYSKGGDDAGDGLARLQQYVAEEGAIIPDYALVMLGINDALRFHGFAQMEDDIEAIIDLYQSLGTEVLLARPDAEYPFRQGNKGWTDPDDQFQFDAVYERLSAQENVPLEPRFTDGVLEDLSLLESDRFHPNPQGVAVMVENILPETLDLLGPPSSPGSDQPDLALAEGTIAMTIEADRIAGRQALFSKDASGYGDGGHATLWLEGSAVRLRLQDENRSYELRSDAGAVDAGKETHIAFSFGDEDGVRLYVDGQVVASHGYQGGLDGNDEPWVLGANTATSSTGALNNLRHFFDGEISDFLVFDRALKNAEVGALAAEAWV